MHQDLNAGLGLIIFRFYGIPLFIQPPLPVVSGDGEKMRIPEEGNKRIQDTSLRNPRQAS